MDFNKLTLKSQEAVAAAQELARRAGNAELTPDGNVQPQASAALSRVLDRAFDESAALGDEFVSVEHLLLALEIVPRDALLAAL